MSSLIRNGWEIIFSKIFNEQRNDLKKEVTSLKLSLSDEEFIRHPTVKILAAIMRGLKEEIVKDPYASCFALTGVLHKYGRLKGLGLDSRYRLFFRAIEAGERKIIFVLWLGYPRKAGAKNDCYEVFTKRVLSENYPQNLEELLIDSE